MNILTNSPNKIKYITPLRQARADAFLEYMEVEEGGVAVFLNKELYDYWSNREWTRADVDNAINDLAAQQIISVSSFMNGHITLGVYEPKDIERINGGIV